MEGIVTTRQGKVQGSLSNGVHAFKGILNAAPPFGENRLPPPQSVKAWAGLQWGLAYRPKPPRVPHPSPLNSFFPKVFTSGENFVVGKSTAIVLVSVNL